MKVQSKKRNAFQLNSMPELIRQSSKPTNFLQIESMVLSDIKKKMVSDEMNSIDFYDIQPLDTGKQNKDKNFRSIHFFQDVSQIRGTKFHQKIKPTDLESKLRSKIQEEPGSKLFMREIYEYLEENREFPQQKKPDVEPSLEVTLDGWHKKMKQKRLEKDKRSSQVEEDIFLQRARTIEQKKRQGDKKKKDMATVAILALPMIQKENGVAEGNSKVDLKVDTPNSPPTGSVPISIFKKKMLESLHQQGSDRKVMKNVQKYLNQGEGLTQKDFEKIDQKKVSRSNDIVTDFSVEGLQRALHTLIKMQFTNFSNAHDRSAFYEKQTNHIVHSVIEKIKNQEKEIQKRHIRLSLVRTECHEIHDKMRQIKMLLQQLQDELKALGQNPKDQKQPSKVSTTVSQGRQGNIDNLINVIQKQNEIENDIKTMKESYENFNARLHSNNKQIDFIENEILKLQKNNKGLQKAKQGFLLELLLLGLDCRNSGLSWIIQDLWECGEKVNETNLPPFLDGKCQEFLFTKTKRLVELGELEKKQHQHFDSYKRQLNYQGPQLDLSVTQEQQCISINQKSLSSSTFTNSFALINSGQIKFQKTMYSRLKNADQTNILLHGLTDRERRCIDNTLNELNSTKHTVNDLIYKEAQRKLGEAFKNDDVINNTQLQELKDKLIKEYLEIEQTIYDKQLQLLKLEQLELNRMIKEIDYKNYLKRYNADAMQVMAALFGYHKAEREIIKNGMMRKQ